MSIESHVSYDQRYKRWCLKLRARLFHLRKGLHTASSSLGLQEVSQMDPSMSILNGHAASATAQHGPTMSSHRTSAQWDHLRQLPEISQIEHTVLAESISPPEGSLKYFNISAKIQNPQHLTSMEAVFGNKAWGHPSGQFRRIEESKAPQISPVSSGFSVTQRLCPVLSPGTELHPRSSASGRAWWLLSPTHKNGFPVVLTWLAQA